MANTSDSTPSSYNRLSDSSAEDQHTSAIDDDKSSPAPQSDTDTGTLEGLDNHVFHLVNSLPPEILRGKHAVVPSTKPKRGLSPGLPPISNIADIFDDLASKAHANGIDEFLEHIKSRELRVATMCSGTESPLLALEMLTDSFRRLFGKTFYMHHLFSAEIEPFKQSYIQRNFSPDIIFRDVNELVADEATTAFGSLRQVPTDPDLLVVGFSCVDFSQLNFHRKTLDEMGESGHTFFAVLRYMSKCRPTLVVLENVSSAPWKRIEEAMDMIDYRGHSIKVDTKNYYLPQTRERGYMFCVDRRRLTTESDENSKSSPFALMMKKFQRPASSPVTDFLLKQDDPRLRDAIDDISVGSVQDRQAVDWTRYKARHLAYRVQEGLGNRRPLTRWQDNGTCKMPDFYWHGWSRTQTERVWDTLDVNYLRTLVRGYDINFKSRVIDLSQGLDRELDQRASGLAGCLTPRGQHFITSRGGPLLGIEALALQGIPIDRLLLSTDSQRELHDLAGNAMSSTVVGAAILSALIIGHQALIPGSSRKTSHHAPPVADTSNTSDVFPSTKFLGQPDRSNRSPIVPSPGPANNDKDMPAVPLDRLRLDALSTVEVMDMGRRSSRLCLCEGQTLSKQAGILRCCECGHTACVSCAGNPTHVYEAVPRHELLARIPPSDFERQLKTKLPMRLELRGLDISTLATLREVVVAERQLEDAASAWDKFKDVFEAAVGNELRFCGIKRAQFWTVTYEGSHSILELTCWANRLEWSLYVLPSKDEPSNSPLRQILMRPVATMVPSGEVLLEGIWHIHSPISSQFKIDVRGQGEKLQSLTSRAGLQHPDFRTSKVWSHLVVSVSESLAAELQFDISGKYELLQGCGAANGSLHKKLSSDAPENIYLFLDPTDIGPPEFDSWSFALEHERLDIGQRRDSIAQVRPNWSAFRLKDLRQTVPCWHRRRVEAPGTILSIYEPSVQATYRISTSEQVLSSVGTDCKNAAISILSCSAPATVDEQSMDQNVWNSSDLMVSTDILRRFAWLLQRAISVNEFEEWMTVDVGNRTFSTDCKLCAPEKPRLMWALDERDRVYPYEDPQDAALYERSVKNRPSIFVGHTMLDAESLLNVKICLNITTLLHQAIGKLNKPEEPSLQWRLCIDATGFIRPRLPKLLLRNNKADLEHPQPPGFKRFPLRPEQLRSLTWMVRQERDDMDPFEEEEVVEALIPAINWRVEGRAAIKKSVRGGILGDDVGYGKTAISLGLIDVQFQYESTPLPNISNGAIPLKATLIVVPHHLFSQWSREIGKFLQTKYRVLELKTIRPLNNCTVNEIEKFDIVVMSSSLLRGGAYYSRMELFAGAPGVPKGDGRIFEEWLSDTMAGIRENVDLLVNEGSLSLLDRICAKHKAMQSGEGFSKYRPSKRFKGMKLQEHLAKQRQEKRVEEASNEVDEPKDFPEQETSVPDSEALESGPQRAKRKRVKSSKVQDTTEDLELGEGKDTQSKPGIRPQKDLLHEIDSTFQLGDAKNDWKRLRGAPIHTFEFNRLIIDEFTYSKDRNYASAVAIPARKKWILSGTPPLNDFADVKSFAPFLGVNIGVDEEQYGKCDNERLKIIQRERTEAEHFQPYVTRHSAAWHSHRHEVAQNFLNRFMRKNEPDIGEIPWTEHICGIVLSPEERSVYLELFMQLMTQNLRIRRHGRGLYDSAEVARLDAIIGDSESPEEALLKRCCLFAQPGVTDQGSGETGQLVGISVEDAVDRVRHAEFKNLGKDILAKLRQGLYLKRKLNALNEDGVILQFDALLDNIRYAEFGDIFVTRHILRLVEKAEASSNPERDEREFYLSPNERPQDSRDTRTEVPQGRSEIMSGLNNCTDSLRRLIHETITRARASRLFHAVSAFQKNAPGSIFGCVSCRHKGGGPEIYHILGECGHSVCGDCLPKCVREEHCRFPGCSGSVQPYRIIKRGDLAQHDGMPTSDHWQMFKSSKNAELVKLLQDTNKIPAEDQVVLFVQFAELIDGASAALDIANIPHKAVKSNDRTTETAVTNFQTGNESVRSKVLILALGDVTASGLNLQNANHIIFYAPLVARSQYDYDSGMAQAIGRCRRYGQQKHVHIYHLLTLNTVEVNIFEQRRREQIVRRNGEYLSADRNAVLAADERGWRGFSLDGTNAEEWEEAGDNHN